jgi:predicted nucleotide-binding protein
VAFAIVILTGDDQGSVVGSEDFNLRARQNVIFELGFFFGSIERRRVAVLYENGVELPSDISGLLYTAMDDDGGWRIALGRELRNAGLPVDMNKAL